MSTCLVRILPLLLVVALCHAPSIAQESGGTSTHPFTQEHLERLRGLIEQVEDSGKELTPFVLVVLQASADAVRTDLRAARESPDETGITDAQIRQARHLLNRLASLLLSPAVRDFDERLDELEARDTPVTRRDLIALGPAERELRSRTEQITAELDPEIARKPDGLTGAQDLLRRFSTLDFEVAARDLLSKTEHWETLSPAPTAEELAPVRKEALDLEERINWVAQSEHAIPTKTEERVRAAIARAGTLELIPFTESLMPALVELESRETALTDTELARAEEKAIELHDRIEAVRPGMLDGYDPDAPPACARARTVLRRLVSLEIQPSIDNGRQIISELEARDEIPEDDELAAYRPGADELRELIAGFEERSVAQSPEAEPDLIQQARELLWRFAQIDLARSVADMESFVTTLEGNKKGPSPDELAELNRLAEQMQPKLRAARGKDDARLPEEEREEPTPQVVVQARDLMRRSAALQPQTLAAAEEERDAPVTLPFLNWFRFYGSLRLRSFLAADGFSRIDDETSRIGVRLQKRVSEKFELFGRFEIGINPLELATNDSDLSKDRDTASELFPIRLAYFGTETPWGSATIGKVWSTYWNVAVFSDQLPAYTGLTTGTFNNGDGSVSGTGRTDNTIQYRGATGSYNYAAQMQIRNLTRNSRPVADTLGGSTIFERRDGIDIGGAFSIVRDGVDDPAADEPKRGDRAVIVGARAKDESRYFGATLAYTTNHYQDDLGAYFDGIGFEVYSDYLVHKKVRLRFVADGLFPVGGYQGDYRLIYLVAGASYDILKQLRVFLLPRLTFSKNSDGSDRGDHAVAVLLLWNF